MAEGRRAVSYPRRLSFIVRWIQVYKLLIRTRKPKVTSTGAPSCDYLGEH